MERQDSFVHCHALNDVAIDGKLCPGGRTAESCERNFQPVARLSSGGGSPPLLHRMKQFEKADAITTEGAPNTNCRTKLWMHLGRQQPGRFLSSPHQLKIICWGTCETTVGRTDSKQALATKRNLLSLWAKPFGLPELLIADQGPELAGDAFADFFREKDSLVHFIDGRMGQLSEQEVLPSKSLLWDKIILDATMSDNDEFSKLWAFR